MRQTAVILGLAFSLLLAGCGKTETPKAAGGGAAKATVPPPPAEPPGPDLLAEALGQAKKDGKNLFVEYYDPTCNFCSQMDKEVWPDEFVKEYMKEVVYLRLVRGKNGKPFEDRFGKKPTPSFVVLVPDDARGTQVGTTLTGFLPVDGLMDLLLWAAKPEGEMPTLEPGGS